ncbi:hypothetical protein [Chryseobacterium indoltheticum]|uniref:hypothetical protein n=1 Tax=Chryseobacterium indoltheticum TaxID=254 RepID=UPI0028E47027|nr:hypothetical protein [Chryseobacterium indoltheticum]
MEINKIKILIITFTLIFVIGKAQKSYIYVAPMDVTVPYSISCNTLLDAFNESIEKIKLSNKRKEYIYSLIIPLKKRTTKPYTDIRYKGEICFKKQKINFCGDESTISVNGIDYETSKELIQYIKNLRKPDLSL